MFGDEGVVEYWFVIFGLGFVFLGEEEFGDFVDCCYVVV